MFRVAKPSLKDVQVAPASVVRKTPAWLVPAYIVVGASGSIASAVISIDASPAFRAIHVVLPSMLRNTPSSVASTSVPRANGSTTIARMLLTPAGVGEGCQDAAPLLVLNS